MKNKVLLLTLLLFAAGCSSHYDTAESTCNINVGSCVKSIEEEKLHIIFDITPAPVVPMKELIFSITVLNDGKPLRGAEVILDLTMPGMYMGVNRPELTQGRNGRYEGAGVLPECPMGGNEWKADIDILKDDLTASASYIFEVE